MNWFITGTDTGVGKTFAARLLVRALRSAGLDTVAMKPICCGDRADAEILYHAAEESIPINDVNPVWLRPPLAPYAAAMIESRQIDLGLITETFRRLRATHKSLLVEGVGGWMVPIRRDYFVKDLAQDFGLSVVVVVNDRLGAINHTILTVQSIQESGLTCAGIILNRIDPADDAVATNRAILEDLLTVPILFELAPGQKEIELALA